MKREIIEEGNGWVIERDSSNYYHLFIGDKWIESDMDIEKLKKIQEECIDKSSMLYWYPKIKDLDIPQPETVILEFPEMKNGDWSCFVEKEENLIPNIRRIVEFSFMADMLGLQIGAIVLRKYIEMDSRFVAFQGDLPVNPERRYFIKNGKLQCYHPYWIHEAMRKAL